MNLARLVLQHVLGNGQHVADKAGGLAGLGQHLDALVGGERGGDVGLVGDRRADGARDDGGAGIGGGHRQFADVADRHAVLLQDIVQQQVAGRALLERHLLALEVGRRLDVVAFHQDGVGLGRGVHQQDALERDARLHLDQQLLDGFVVAVDLARRDRRAHVLVLDEVDQFDVFEAVGLEEALFLGDVPHAVAEPGLDRQFEHAGLDGRVLGKGRARHRQRAGEQCGDRDGPNYVLANSHHFFLAPIVVVVILRWSCRWTLRSAWSAG